MNYRELLELTKNHPNPFSINGRKNRFFDFEVKNQHTAEEQKLNDSHKKNIQNKY